MRSLFVAAAALCVACGPLTPANDGGTGGGGGFLTGGGGGFTTGGGTATGGGATTGGGGGTTTGGGGGTTTGGGGGTTGGGGGTTGGGGGATGGGGGLAPLTFASMNLVGDPTPSSSYIIGLGGSSNDVWAIQDTGHLFRSTGGAFNWVFTIQYGAKALYAKNNTVVIVQTRNIRTCPSTNNCTVEASYETFSLLNSGANLNLFGEAACGQAANDITVVVSDTNNMAGLFHWDGMTWTRTNANLGIRYPRACFYDAAGRLHVVGEDAIAIEEEGAVTIDPITTNLTNFSGAVLSEGQYFAVGYNALWRKPMGGAWTQFQLPTTQTLHVAVGLAPNELYMLGYYNSTNGNGWKWNGTTFTAAGTTLLPSTGSQSLIRTSLVTSPTEFFLGGSNTAGPLIVRARR